MFISVQNSKTGPSFNLPAEITCPGKTDICTSVCYADKGRMGLPFQTARRHENLQDILFLLKSDPSGKLLRNALNQAVRKARIPEQSGEIASLRIHDSGDFFSKIYTNAWTSVVHRNPSINFWAYTRSFAVPGLLEPLLTLASLPNMAL